jgi:hypothetical protein
MGRRYSHGARQIPLVKAATGPSPVAPTRSWFGAPLPHASTMPRIYCIFGGKPQLGPPGPSGEICARWARPLYGFTVPSNLYQFPCVISPAQRYLISLTSSSLNQVQEILHLVGEIFQCPGAQSVGFNLLLHGSSHE